MHTSKGTYGSVFQATLNNLPCAANSYTWSSTQPYNSQFCSMFLSEMPHSEKFTPLSYSAVPVGCTGSPQTWTHIILLMELMKESLKEFLKCSKTILTYQVQMNVTHDIALVPAYLHGTHVLHCDLSSNNMLSLNDSCRAKATEFHSTCRLYIL